MANTDWASEAFKKGGAWAAEPDWNARYANSRIARQYNHGDQPRAKNLNFAYEAALALDKAEKMLPSDMLLLALPSLAQEIQAKFLQSQGFETVRTDPPYEGPEYDNHSPSFPESYGRRILDEAAKEYFEKNPRDNAAKKAIMVALYKNPLSLAAEEAIYDGYIKRDQRVPLVVAYHQEQKAKLPEKYKGEPLEAQEIRVEVEKVMDVINASVAESVKLANAQQKNAQALLAR